MWDTSDEKFHWISLRSLTGIGKWFVKLGINWDMNSGLLGEHPKSCVWLHSKAVLAALLGSFCIEMLSHRSWQNVAIWRAWRLSLHSFPHWLFPLQALSFCLLSLLSCLLISSLHLPLPQSNHFVPIFHFWLPKFSSIFAKDLFSSLVILHFLSLSRPVPSCSLLSPHTLFTPLSTPLLLTSFQSSNRFLLPPPCLLSFLLVCSSISSPLSVSSSFPFSFSSSSPLLFLFLPYYFSRYLVRCIQTRSWSNLCICLCVSSHPGSQPRENVSILHSGQIVCVCARMCLCVRIGLCAKHLFGCTQYNMCNALMADRGGGTVTFTACRKSLCLSYWKVFVCHCPCVWVCVCMFSCSLLNQTLRLQALI